MAYPMLLTEGYLRTPYATPESKNKAYVHDGFGADTGGRVRPHSGFDSSPTVKNATACSVLAGTVTRTGVSKYAGNYVEILSSDGKLWLYIHLAAIAVPVGANVYPGQGIGIIGNTGGGGALGKPGPLAVHLHTSRCDNRAAADRILNGLVRERYKNESTAQWAAAHGLSDPWPVIRESVQAKPEVPVVDEEEEDEMIIWMAGKNPGHGILMVQGALAKLNSAEERKNLINAGAKVIWVEEATLNNGIINDARGRDDFIPKRP